MHQGHQGPGLRLTCMCVPWVFPCYKAKVPFPLHPIKEGLLSGVEKLSGGAPGTTARVLPAMRTCKAQWGWPSALLTVTTSVPLQKLLWSRPNGSGLGKQACHQPHDLSFIPGSPHGRKRKLPPASYLLNSTGASQSVCAHAHTRTTQINLLLNKIIIKIILKIAGESIKLHNLLGKFLFTMNTHYPTHTYGQEMKTLNKWTNLKKPGNV